MEKIYTLETSLAKVTQVVDQLVGYKPMLQNDKPKEVVIEKQEFEQLETKRYLKQPKFNKVLELDAQIDMSLCSDSEK